MKCVLENTTFNRKQNQQKMTEVQLAEAKKLLWRCQKRSWIVYLRHRDTEFNVTILDGPRGCGKHSLILDWAKEFSLLLIRVNSINHFPVPSKGFSSWYASIRRKPVVLVDDINLLTANDIAFLGFCGRNKVHVICIEPGTVNFKKNKWLWKRRVFQIPYLSRSMVANAIRQIPGYLGHVPPVSSNLHRGAGDRRVQRNNFPKQELSKVSRHEVSYDCFLDTLPVELVSLYRSTLDEKYSDPSVHPRRAKEALLSERRCVNRRLEHERLCYAPKTYHFEQGRTGHTDPRATRNTLFLTHWYSLNTTQ